MRSPMEAALSAVRAVVDLSTWSVVAHIPADMAMGSRIVSVGLDGSSRQQTDAHTVSLVRVRVHAPTMREAYQTAWQIESDLLDTPNTELGVRGVLPASGPVVLLDPDNDIPMAALTVQLHTIG